jgi:hypothetical protein
MNLKTTFILLVLAAGAVVFGFLGTGAKWLGLTHEAPNPAGAGTLEILESQFTAEALTRIEIQPRGAERPVTLERGSGNVWTAPGQWPTRKPEVEQLVALLSGLRSRFVPIPLESDEALAEYGLDKPAVQVMVKAGPTDYRLLLSEHAPPGEQDDEQISRLDVPTYLRLAVGNDQKPEVVRLAPGLVAALSRPLDYYLQRRLFADVERVVKDGFGDTQEKVEQLTAKGLAVEDKKPDGSNYTLVKNGEDWELSQPVHDRLDPDRKKSVLQAIPDIWAEQFVTKPEKDLAKYGLKDPEQVIRVTPTGSDKSIVLLIGSESPTKKVRTVTRPAPAMGGLPPQQMAQKIEEHFRYARLENNEQIFEVKADKLKDVFVPVAELRDARVARFETKDVTQLELTHGSEQILLVKGKDKGADRWRMEKPTASDAESTKITEVLDKLAFLSARDKDVLDKSDPKIDGLDKPQATLAVTFQEEIKGEGETKTKKPARTLSFTIGRHDAEKKKLYVKDEWGRINVVDDGLQTLLARPAMAYRGRRIFDTLGLTVQTIHVDRQGQQILGLGKSQSESPPGWQLLGNGGDRAPADHVDQAKAEQLVSDLTNLEAVEFVNEAPKKEELDAKYGLEKPALKVQLGFGNGRQHFLLYVGKQRDGKAEYYAQSNLPAVFVVKKELVDKLNQDSLSYRSLQLWRVSADDITTITVTKEGHDEYRLSRRDKEWQINGPFEAPAMGATIRTMTQELASPRSEKCFAHSAKDKELEKYGLDKPHLRVTITIKDGDKTKDHTLLVGKPADQPASARYAKLGDGEAIYTVPDKLLAATDHAALDLLDKKLLALDAKDINSIKSNAGGVATKLQRQEKGWKVVESPAGQPYDADVQTVSSLVSVWTNLTAQRFAAYGPKADFAKFGLDKPAWTVTVGSTANGKSAGHSLTFGKPVENSAGDRYARLDNGTGIVVLPASTVKELERTYLDFVDRTLLKFDPATGSGLVRKQGAETLELVKKDDNWRILKPADLQADDKTMQGLFEQMSTLRAEKVVAYPAKDVQQYGLDQPLAVVKLQLMAADGKPSEKVLKIGKESGDPNQAQASAHFVQVEGSPVVCVLSGNIARQLLAGPIAYRDRNLARFADADKAILKRGPREATFTKVDGTWKLTAPLDAEAEHADMDDFVNVLARLRADELVSDKAKPTPDDLKPYGLDKPAAQWRFLSGDKEVLGLILGRHPDSKSGGKDNRCWAKLTNNDLVFLLDPQTTKRALAEYRSKTLWPTSLDSAQVEMLRYGGSGPSFTLKKDGDNWQVEGKPSVKLNATAVSDALAALAGLKPERYVVDRGADLNLYGLEPPEVVIEAIAPTGRRTLHIGRAEGDSKRYYARVPNKDRSDVFVLSEADAAKLVRQIAGFTQTPIKPTS